MPLWWQMEAARDGIELTELEVSVESESDFRGVLGVDSSVNPGPLAVRVRTRVAASNATDDPVANPSGASGVALSGPRRPDPRNDYHYGGRDRLISREGAP
jgi:hypothetical protein